MINVNKDNNIFEIGGDFEEIMGEWVNLTCFLLENIQETADAEFSMTDLLEIANKSYGAFIERKNNELDLGKIL